MLLAHIAINSSGECRGIPEQGPVQARAAARCSLLLWPHQTTNDNWICHVANFDLPFGATLTRHSLQSLQSSASCSREQPSISFSCHQAYLFSCVCRRLPSINVNSFLSKLSMATCCVLRCVWQRRRRSREGGARWGTHQVKWKRMSRRFVYIWCD